MKVKEVEVPQTDFIKNAFNKIDFSDCFATTNTQNDIETISRKILCTIPKWVNVLMKIRIQIGKLLGLESVIPPGYHNRFEVGGYFSFFQIYKISENEILFGAKDKHLDFCLSILDDKSDAFNIKATTLVQYNNKMGKYYMGFIKPFHRRVLKAIVKQAYLY